jgi:large subunit ribosomal protein L24
MKFKKGDNVMIMTGKDNGKTGKVLTVLNDNNRVLIDGMNLAQKRSRPRKQGEKGQVVSVPRSVAADNVMIVCPNCKEATRIGMNITDKEKFRICKKCQARI